MGKTYTIEDVSDKKVTSDGLVDLTDTEKQALVDKWNAYENDSAERKIAEIRSIRDKKLNESDWQVVMAKEKGTNLTTSFKTWRDNLRNIPADYTTESEYDELLATDDDGNLTHSVWSES